MERTSIKYQSWPRRVMLATCLDSYESTSYRVFASSDEVLEASWVEGRTPYRWFSDLKTAESFCKSIAPAFEDKSGKFLIERCFLTSEGYVMPNG